MAAAQEYDRRWAVWGSRRGATHTTMIAVLVAVGTAAIFTAGHRLGNTDDMVDRIVANTLASRDGQRALDHVQGQLRHAPPESVKVEEREDGTNWLTFTTLTVAKDGTTQVGAVDNNGEFHPDARHRYGVLDGALVWEITTNGEVIGCPVELFSVAPTAKAESTDIITFRARKTPSACLLKLQLPAAPSPLRAVAPLARQTASTPRAAGSRDDRAQPKDH